MSARSTRPSRTTLDELVEDAPRVEASGETTPSDTRAAAASTSGLARESSSSLTAKTPRRTGGQATPRGAAGGGRAAAAPKASKVAPEPSGASATAASGDNGGEGGDNSNSAAPPPPVDVTPPLGATNVLSASPYMAGLRSEASMSVASPLSRPADGLAAAAARGDVAQCRAHLAGGTAVDQADETGVTPLMRAADAGHLDTCQALLLAGADVNLHAADGLSPLAAAMASERLDIQRLLLDRGADLVSATQAFCSNRRSPFKKADRVLAAAVSHLDAAAAPRDAGEAAPSSGLPALTASFFSSVTTGHPQLVARHMERLSALPLERKWVVVYSDGVAASDGAQSGRKKQPSSSPELSPLPPVEQQPFIPPEQPNLYYLPKQCPSYVVADFDVVDDDATTVTGKRRVLSRSLPLVSLLLGALLTWPRLLLTPAHLHPRALRNLRNALIAYICTGVHPIVCVAVVAVLVLVAFALLLPLSFACAWLLEWPYFWSGSADFIQSQLPRERTFRVDLIPVPGLAALPGAALLKPLLAANLPARTFAERSIRAHITHRWQNFTSLFVLIQFLDRLLYLCVFLTYALLLRSPDAADVDTVSPGDKCAKPVGLQLYAVYALGIMTYSYLAQEVLQLIRSG